MPYVFISAVALCANLYRCAPLIVGDKYADPELMKFLGAKITTDYPEPNSPPMYVMFATMRSVLDALQEMGYELSCSQVVQGYTTWIMSKPFEDPQLAKSSDELYSEPMAFKPEREKPSMVDEMVETDDVGYPHYLELPTNEPKDFKESSIRSLKRFLHKSDSDQSKKLRKTQIPDVNESTSTRDLQSESVKNTRPQEGELKTSESSFTRRQNMRVQGSELSKTESSFTRRQNLTPKESTIEETEEEETKQQNAEAPAPEHPKKTKWARGSSESSREPTTKHKNPKVQGRRTSTVVKENFK